MLQGPVNKVSLNARCNVGISLLKEGFVCSTLVRLDS